MAGIKLIPYRDEDYEFVYEVKKMHTESMSKKNGEAGMKKNSENILTTLLQM